MGEILKSWLRRKLGITIDLKPEIFGHYTADGTLLAQLLHSYDIIGDNQLILIVQTHDPALCRVNLKHLRLWLRFINVDCDDECIEDISNGKGTRSLQLFYKVYLGLENKDRLHFITLQKEREKYAPTSAKFDVSVVEETPPEEQHDHPFAKYLCDGAPSIQWHRNKFRSIVDACRKERQRFVEMEKAAIVEETTTVKTIDAKDQREEEKKEMDAFAKTHRVRAIVKKGQKDSRESATEDLAQGAYTNPEAAKAYVKWLKDRTRRMKTSQGLKDKMQKFLLSNFWAQLQEKQERSFDELLAQRVLSQSQYEKQMIAKLADIRRQKSMMTTNREIVDNLMQDTKERVLRRGVERETEQAAKKSEEIDMECMRMCELHQRIRQEKVKKLREKHRRICQEIIHDIADIAICTADYLRSHGGVPKAIWNEWKALFLKNQPIFELVADLGEEFEELDDDEVEKSVLLERERQKALGDADFENYQNLLSPWNEYMPNVNDETEEILRLGGTVLGFVVHRLLEFLYPYPADQVKAPVPKLRVAAIVRGVNDPTCLQQLGQLLKKSEIVLVTMENAINHCLSRYKQEMTDAKYIDLNIIQATNHEIKQMQMQQRSHESTIKNASTAKSKKSSPLSTKHLRYIMSTGDKETQTPRVIPYDDADPDLTDTAYIGKWAYEFLTLGQPISDDLAIKILIEYLKSLVDIKGWALVNYPDTYDQMSRLEYALTGCKVPPDSKVLDFMDVNIEDIDPPPPRIVYEDSEVDPFAECRLSKLLPNPIVRVESYDTTSTFMTTYVRAIKKPKHVDTNEDDKFEILPEDATSMDNFYTDQSVAYVAYYQTFNLEVLKKVARLIIGDKSLVRIPSEVLFGKVLRKLAAREHNHDHDARKSTVKQLVPRTSTNEGEVEEEEEEEEQVEQEEEGLEHPDAAGDFAKPEVEVTLRPVRPGEEGWEWIELLLPPLVLDALSTFWENLEVVYIEDLRDMFSLKRLHSASVVPYKDYITRNMQEFIVRPDLKQNLLHAFHRDYNDVDPDMRDDPDVKCELHCRVNEFQMQLWEQCDDRRIKAEEERQRIVREDWAHVEATVLVKVYLGLVQAEIDRCVDTVQMIQDYYTAMLQRPLQPQRIAKIFLNEIDIGIPSALKLEDQSNVQKDSRAKTDSSVPIVDPASFREEIVDLLIDVANEVFDPAESSVYKIIVDNIYYVQKSVDAIYYKATDTLKKEESGISVSIMAKEKTDKSLRNGKENLPPQSEQIAKKATELFCEWRSALLFEINRIRTRLKLLISAAEADVTYLLDTIREAFHRIHQKIIERYQREVKSVNNLGAVFCHAIEEGTAIQQELLLDGDQFVVRSNVLMYPSPAEAPPQPAKEAVQSFRFQIVQLGRLMDIFKRVAPSGYLPEQALLFILQDLVACGDEHGLPNPLPTAWQALQPRDIEELIDRLFGSMDTIDWREFIIYAMELPIPTEQDILKTRDAYRRQDPDLQESITRQQYNSTPLWFLECVEMPSDSKYVIHAKYHRRPSELYEEESDLCFHKSRSGIIIPPTVQKLKNLPGASNEENENNSSDLEELTKLFLAKELLYQMHMTSGHNINYTCFLLAFCKDEDPRLGLGKALSLAMGCRLCIDPEEGERYVQILISQRRHSQQSELSKELLHAETHQMATKLVHSLILKTLREMDPSPKSVSDEKDLQRQETILIELLDEKGGFIDPSALVSEQIASPELKIDSASNDSSIEECFEDTGVCHSHRMSEESTAKERGRTEFNLAYWVPRDVCYTVLCALLPFQSSGQELFDSSKTLQEHVDQIYADLRDDMISDDPDIVLAFRLIDHEFITKLLDKTNKLTAKRISPVIIDILRKKIRA